MFHGLKEEMTEIGHELWLLQFFINGHYLLDEDFICFASIVKLEMAQEDVVNNAIGIFLA